MKVETGTDYIKRVIAAAPFADNEAGIPQMCELITNLAAERDALVKRAEDAERQANELETAWDERRVKWAAMVQDTQVRRDAAHARAEQLEELLSLALRELDACGAYTIPRQIRFALAAQEEGDDGE